MNMTWTLHAADYHTDLYSTWQTEEPTVDNSMLMKYLHRLQFAYIFNNLSLFC